MLIKMDTLCCNDISSISTTRNDIRHHGDECMFFNIERAGVERPSVSEGPKPRRRQDPFEEPSAWEGEKLSNQTSDINGGI